MTNAVARMHPGSFDPDIATQRLVARLAMMARATVDIPHAKLPQYRIVGFIIEPDEHHRKGEGIEMMAALQRLAGLSLEDVASGIKERMNDPVDFAAYRTETTA